MSVGLTEIKRGLSPIVPRGRYHPGPELAPVRAELVEAHYEKRPSTGSGRTEWGKQPANGGACGRRSLIKARVSAGEKEFEHVVNFGIEQLGSHPGHSDVVVRRHQKLVKTGARLAKS